MKDRRNWQIGINNPLTTVEGINDIMQCVYIIISTVPGSDPLRPTFGSNVYQYLDKPISEVRAKIVNAVTDAIGKWEKRLEVTRCIVEKKDNLTKITIEGVIIASSEPITISITV